MMFRRVSGKRGLDPYRSSRFFREDDPLKGLFQKAFPITEEEKKEILDIFFNKEDKTAKSAPQIKSHLKERYPASVPYGYFCMNIGGRLSLLFGEDGVPKTYLDHQEQLDRSLAVLTESPQRKILVSKVTEEVRDKVYRGIVTLMNFCSKESAVRRFKGIHIPEVNYKGHAKYAHSPEWSVFLPEEQYEPLVHLLNHFGYYSMFTEEQMVHIGSLLILWDTWTQPPFRRTKEPIRKYHLQCYNALSQNQMSATTVLAGSSMLRYIDKGTLEERRNILLRALSYGKANAAYALASMKDARDVELFTAMAEGSNRVVQSVIRGFLQSESEGGSCTTHWDDECDKPDWSSLSPELLVEALKFCDAGSILRIQAVCKCWAAAVKDNTACSLFSQWMNEPSDLSKCTMSRYLSWVRFIGDWKQDDSSEPPLIAQEYANSSNNRILQWPKCVAMICICLHLSHEYVASGAVRSCLEIEDTSGSGVDNTVLEEFRKHFFKK